jgi:hypothetical protein
MALCVAGLLVIAPFVHIDAAEPNDPCAAAKMQTDVRPEAGGPPTRVSVGIFMVDLTEVSDPNQTLTGDFAVVLNWTDPRLEHLEGREIPLDDIWSPGLAFFNSGRLFTSRPRVVGIGPGGSVTCISLVPFEWTDKDIELTVDQTVTGRRELLNISDWEIDGVRAVTRTESAPARSALVPYYDFLITAHRITGFYLWKVILPLCLIVAMSWCVFWISPELYGPQIGLSATSMLTLIAFIFATTNMVPELGYFTLLDLFIGGSTILVFLALLESLTVTYLVSGDRKRLARRIDVMSRAVFPLTFLMLVVVIFLR